MSTVLYARPCINLNGTSPTTLMKNLKRVRDLTIKLQMALEEATPHGRDYPSVEQQAMFDRDYQMHRLQISAVKTIEAYIETTMEHIVDQASKKDFD